MGHSTLVRRKVRRSSGASSRGIARLTSHDAEHRVANGTMTIKASPIAGNADNTKPTAGTLLYPASMATATPASSGSATIASSASA